MGIIVIVVFGVTIEAVTRSAPNLIATGDTDTSSEPLVTSLSASSPLASSSSRLPRFFFFRRLRFPFLEGESAAVSVVDLSSVLVLIVSSGLGEEEDGPAADGIGVSLTLGAGLIVFSLVLGFVRVCAGGFPDLIGAYWGA